MRPLMCLVAGSIGVGVLSGPARGDSWAPPRPSVFASDFGSYWVKTFLNDPRTATVTLYTYDKNLALERADGMREFREKAIWSQNVGYIPARLLVSNRGWVVGVNQYAHPGYTHSLVIWDPEGDQLGDYKLEDLLTPDEIRSHVLQIRSSRHWRADFAFQHDGYQGTYDFLVVDVRGSDILQEDSWHKRITVDLRSGKIWPDFDLDSFGRAYEALQHAISMYRAKYSRPVEVACDSDSGSDFVRLYARQNKDASAWEFYVEADGTATLRIKRGEETRYKLGSAQMAHVIETLKESDFGSLPETLEGDDTDPHHRSIIVETTSGTSGMTLFAPNKLTDGVERKQARRFIECWLAIRELFDNADAVDERAEIRDFQP